MCLSKGLESTLNFIVTPFWAGFRHAYSLYMGIFTALWWLDAKTSSPTKTIVYVACTVYETCPLLF
jgi:hypothetical protein